MKNVKMLLTATVILAIAGGALAFTHKGQPKTVYCFATVDVPNIHTSEACNASDQPAGTLVNFKEDEVNGSAIDPCAGVTGKDNPYLTAASACTSAAGLKFIAPGL